MRFRGKHIPDSPYRHLKKILIAITGLFTITILSANIYNTCILDGISVDVKAYDMKNGYPLFKDRTEYIRFIQKYPYNAGVKLTIHTMLIGESYWNITERYGITIDTLIAANPFLKTLKPEEGTQIVIPEQDGILFAFNDILDIWRITSDMNFHGNVRGNYKPGLLKLISNDDIRIVFLPEAKPTLLNDSMKRLYSLKNIFTMPVKGNYTSMFGQRVDPFIHMMAFHNGLDIQAQYGLPVKASRSGIVTFSGWRDGYGNTIEIQHRDGYSTMYAHCSKLISQKGDFVSQNETIGLVGSTGRSTGPHVHFMLMHHGEILNPLTVIW